MCHTSYRPMAHLFLHICNCIYVTHQLQTCGRHTVNVISILSVKNNTLHLSKFFKWFKNKALYLSILNCICIGVQFSSVHLLIKRLTKTIKLNVFLMDICHYVIWNHDYDILQFINELKYEGWKIKIQYTYMYFLHSEFMFMSE